MAYLTEKTINGKKYQYLVKSVRLPNGSIKKISKLTDGNDNLKKLEEKYNGYFIEKEVELNAEYALSRFKTNYVFTKEEITKIESMRVRYKYLIGSLDKAQLKDLFDVFVANYTYETNVLEGNSLTLKDVNIVIFENAVVAGKDLREVYETINARDVMDLVLKKKFDVSHKSAIKIHKMFMRDIDDRIGYKRFPNVLLGRRVETTPPEKVHEEMTKLIDWHNAALKDMHPLQVSAVFHGRFEHIHPFQDGNGRVGRFLSNVILVNNGYPPLIIRKTKRMSYLAALDAFDRGHKEKPERFFLDNFKDTYRKFFEIYLKYL
ncbi:MAG: hypothetical protein MSIBF_02915 [Candidatus Altiarchaeales archaeon IMC4]|nr:MAG: hypothetical protein MSIBF_02915 [Candidatus Altiarchaeales archaeon IMC4]